MLTWYSNGLEASAIAFETNVQLPIDGLILRHVAISAIQLCFLRMAACFIAHSLTSIIASIAHAVIEFKTSFVF
jgi:hypothetical protein